MECKQLSVCTEDAAERKDIEEEEEEEAQLTW